MQIQNHIKSALIALAIAPSLLGSSDAPTPPKEHYKFPVLRANECPAGIFGMRPWDEAMAAAPPAPTHFGVVIMVDGVLYAFPVPVRYKGLLTHQQLVDIIDLGMSQNKVPFKDDKKSPK